jgi:glycine cleavage system H protein
VKAASDVYAPVSGEIVEANAALADSPETVNKDPYGSGWMFRLKPANKAEVDGLLDAKAYEALVASEKH